MGKIIDGDGRLFGKINVFDFLFLTVIVLVLAFVVIQFVPNTSKNKTVPVEVTVSITGLSPEVASRVKNVGEVYLGRSQKLATVKSVTVRPMPAESGRTDLSRADVLLMGNGYLYQAGAYFDNQRVSIGQKIWLRSIYELEGTISDIKNARN